MYPHHLQGKQYVDTATVPANFMERLCCQLPSLVRGLHCLGTIAKLRCPYERRAPASTACKPIDVFSRRSGRRTAILLLAQDALVCKFAVAAMFSLRVQR